jgi:hypothetical protein
MMAAAGNKQATEAEQLRDRFLALTGELATWLTQNEGELGSGGLAAQQERVRGLLTGGGGGGLDRIVEVCTNALARQDHPLFGDVVASLTTFRASQARNADRLLSGIPPEQMKALDEGYLDTARTEGRRSVVVRAAAYQELLKIVGDKNLHPDSKIGSEFGFLGELEKQLKVLADNARTYQGGLTDAYKKTHEWFLARAQEQVVNNALSEYLEESSEIGSGLPFPLGTNRLVKPMSADAVIRLRQNISDVRRDLRSPAFIKTGAASRPEWIEFVQKVDLADGLTSALLVGGATLAQVTVVVEEYKASTEDEWRTSFQFIEKFSGRPGLRIDQPLQSGQKIELGALRVDQPILLKVYDRADSDAPGTGRLRELKSEGPWGAVELMRLPGAQVDVSNPSIWRVSWPIDLDGVKGALRLRLEFPGGRAPTPKDLGL